MTLDFNSAPLQGSPPEPPDILSAALEVAELYPVFPCKADKSPLTTHGFKDATQDPAEIELLFSDRRAVLIGVPTGHRTKILAVDVDVKGGKDGRGWMDEQREVIGLTRQHRTRSGGRHILFEMPQHNIGCSTSKLHDGVDVRANGGYIIFPPSPGYWIELEEEIAALPDSLLTALIDPQKANGTDQDFNTASQQPRDYEQIQALLTAAKPGQWHDNMRNAVASLVGYRGPGPRGCRRERDQDRARQDRPFQAS
jgi:hypothetical protein